MACIFFTGIANYAIKRRTVSAVMLSLALQAFGRPAINFIETRHNFGYIAESEKAVSHLFRFTNSGDSALVIYGIVSGCGCTAADYTSDPIAPGDTGTVTVTYIAEGNPGRFVKGVRVKSNAPPGEMLLTVEGTVIRDDKFKAAGYVCNINGLRLTATRIASGNIEQGKTTCHTVKAINGSDIEVAVSFPHIGVKASAKAIPEKIAPGNEAEITVCYETSGMWGEETVSVPITVNNGVESRTDTIVCLANVMEVFDFATEEERLEAPIINVERRALNFGERDRKEKTTGEIKISNTGKRVLNIRKIETSSACISASVRKDRVKSGDTTSLTVTLCPDKLGKTQHLLNERIRIITDDPENPVTQIQITASFR